MGKDDGTVIQEPYGQIPVEFETLEEAQNYASNKALEDERDLYIIAVNHVCFTRRVTTIEFDLPEEE